MLTTAVILAAGCGRRLMPYTNTRPKCLIEVGDKPLLAHILDALNTNGFKRVVIVSGHLSEQLDHYLHQHQHGLDVTTVYNHRYDTTNNIYSLWLASPWVHEGFVLIESDLIFDPEALAPFTLPDRIALDHYNPVQHNGTTALVNENGYLDDLFLLADGTNDGRKNGARLPTHTESRPLYKTVNISSFSNKTWLRIQSRLEDFIGREKLDHYYEIVLQGLVRSGKIHLEAIDFSRFWWDEIDSFEDLERVILAEKNIKTVDFSDVLRR